MEPPYFFKHAIPCSETPTKLNKGEVTVIAINRGKKWKWAVKIGHSLSHYAVFFYQ